MTTPLLVWLTLTDLLGVPFDVTAPGLSPTFPSGGNGFAASIVGALAALGILIVVMIYVSSKPKNRRHR